MLCVCGGDKLKAHEGMQNECFQTNESLTFHWVRFY